MARVQFPVTEINFYQTLTLVQWELNLVVKRLVFVLNVIQRVRALMSSFPNCKYVPAYEGFLERVCKSCLNSGKECPVLWAGKKNH